MQIKKWEIPGVVRVDGPKDQKNLEGFLDRNPDFRDSFNHRLRHAGVLAEVGEPADLDSIQEAPAIRPRRRASVPNPMHMSAAIERYAAAKLNAGANTERTVRDKKRAILGFCARLPHLEPPLAADPRVHDIQTFHLAAFLDGIVVQTRRRKGDGEDTGADTKKASTVVKLVSDLSTFFDYAVNELQATSINPAAGLQSRIRELRSTASSQKEHYLPYTTAHLKRIFEPARYLAENRQADYFWAPLLGLHLGARLGELVTLKVSAIGREKITDVWYLEVTPEEAKNDNSVRWLPITDRLIELGFLEYVEHVRSLGAIYLFPHQETTTKTWQSDPSKNASRNYAAYMDKIGLSERLLVFHSYRHTVVTALQDGGTGLADSMQIAGHQAMDHALRTGAITPQQARSVHLDVYTHADMVRMSVDHPMLRLKTVLDRCVQVELDYRRLKKAARIVLEHTRKAANGKFESGWPTLRVKQTQAMLAHLDAD